MSDGFTLIPRLISFMENHSTEDNGIELQSILCYRMLGKLTLSMVGFVSDN